MSVNIKVFYPEVQRLLHDQNSVRVEGKTVGECLQSLSAQYPGVEKWLYDARGQLLKQVFVYVNAESLRKPTLSHPVRDTDELILVVLVTGG